MSAGRRGRRGPWARRVGGQGNAQDVPTVHSGPVWPGSVWFNLAWSNPAVDFLDFRFHVLFHVTVLVIVISFEL